MKKPMIKFFAIFILVFLFLFNVSFVLAAELPNPLGGIKDPREVIGNVIRAIFGIVGSLALAIFIYGGFMWVTSAGNEEKVKKGKDMIMWAAFGLAVIFVSYALVTFVINAVVGGGGSSGGQAIETGGGIPLPD